MSADAIHAYQTELLSQAEQVGALKFGQFTLKSGRISPYFFNAGLMSSGKILDTIANAYAATIVDALDAHVVPAFDVIFGPAYKGISLAACTTLVLSAKYDRSYGFAYDRKEEKAHGEGGKLVGASIQGKKVLILDDVMTAGTAVRLAIQSIQAEGGEVVGVVQLLDREERGKDGGSTVEEVEAIVGGKGRVLSVLKMRTVMAWLEENGKLDVLGKMQAYWDKYGWKA
ncbi:phosphoribosyl transferase [Boletus reticuloceps]|uniref:orotate phosphoribosyltransferase n=1 Tax=Boletus reticuloceps TaxID=495285 RepID=A0A8I2YX31_9AGAM|nr:phosphoribosyl transferase [Boletus reticuloceps]